MVGARNEAGRRTEHSVGSIGGAVADRTPWAEAGKAVARGGTRPNAAVSPNKFFVGTGSRTRSLHHHRPAVVVSPTESDGAEFFDAHEEITWTPEPVANHTINKRYVGLWSRDDEGYVGGEEVLPASIRQEERTTTVQGNAERGRADTSASEQKARAEGTSRSNSLRALFPSRASMLQIEDRRSMRSLGNEALDASWKESSPSIQPELGAVGAIRVQGSSITAESEEHRRTLASRGERWEGSVRSDGLDVEGHGEEASTASGTTITEGGWESGQGFEVEEAELDLGTIGGETGAGAMNEGGSASPPMRKKSSLQRVLESARTRHQHHEKHFKKVMNIGRRRRRTTLDNSNSSNNNGIASPPIDSGTTSPDWVMGSDTATMTARLQDEAGARIADVSTSGGSRGLHLSRQTKGGGKNERMSWAPEVKIQHHGRGTKKKDGLLRSMHMVQCLRYHEGPVWTLAFNRRGTRMATGGQDGKVVIWDLSAPQTRRQKADGAGKGGASFGMDSGGDDGETKGRRNSADNAELDEDEMDGVSTARRRRSSTMGGGEDCGAREAFPRETSSTSGLSDDVVSAGRASSDLSVAENGGKERSVSALEVFNPVPVRIFTGHKSDVVDLSWSHSDFLCSASIDHTVMLWHPLGEERLHTFKHPDFVTSVQFHPLDEHIVLTGCFDRKLRLWATSNGRVMNWVQCQDMISAANFSPDGQLTAAGLYDGRVMFYHTTDLRYYTQIHCKNRRGGNRRGKKVTGLAFAETAKLRQSGQQHRDAVAGATGASREGAACSTSALDSATAAASGSARDVLQDGQLGKAKSMSAQYSLLSTTNDSRLRVYDLDNFTMTNKFKGLVNDDIQIKASFSQDGMFVISGSEDGQVYIWNSKQGRHQMHCSMGGASTSANGGGAGGGGSGNDPTATSCARSGAVSTTAPTAPTERVKSRSSSSFSVQCSIRPKVATVATFVPPTALAAVLESSAFVRGSCARQGCACRGRTNGSGAREGAVGKGWRGGFRRGPSTSGLACAETASGVGANLDEEGGGETSGRGRRRRRWTFAGQARPGGAGRQKMPQQQQRQQLQPDHEGKTMGRKTKSGFVSLSPPGSRPSSSSWQTGRSPGAAVPTSGRSAHSSDDRVGKWVGVGTTAPFVEEAGPPSLACEVPVWAREAGICRRGMVRAIVSADYTGEIKVFLGSVDGLRNGQR